MSDVTRVPGELPYSCAKLPTGQKGVYPFKLECVTVCVGYSDFLALTLPLNKFHFDRIVIVTSPQDTATKRICEFYHVECVVVGGLKPARGEFLKGVAINEGIKRLSLDGWLVHMDADIGLPPETRGILERADLDPGSIYGIDRFDVIGRRAWESFKDLPILQQEAQTFVHLNAFPVATRFMQSWAGGYVPIGFFQLWCPSVSGIKDYPDQHRDAGRGDTLQSQRWQRRYRGFIPELVGYHLESDDSVMGANWTGRKTKAFTIDTVPNPPTAPVRKGQRVLPQTRHKSFPHKETK
jgi:hypothetical protein